MESLWYDKEGNQISADKWSELRSEDPDYYRVAETYVKGTRVSTVWLGLDHSWLGGPPLIFESMVFGGKHDQHMDRYSTESEARKGHERIVRMVTPWWRRWGIKLHPAPDADRREAKGT